MQAKSGTDDVTGGFWKEDLTDGFRQEDLTDGFFKEDQTGGFYKENVREDKVDCTKGGMDCINSVALRSGRGSGR